MQTLEDRPLERSAGDTTAEPIADPPAHFDPAVASGDGSGEGSTDAREGVDTPARWMRILGWSFLVLGIVMTFSEIGGLKDAGGRDLNFFRPWDWRLGDLFSRTTAAGGDMGAHVWTPDYLRRELLGQLRPTGWADDWYAGFPVLSFYFPAPSWAIALLSFVIPYNVAFKLITVAGILTLPLSAYAFGRLCALRQPLPFLLGFAAFPFLFDRQWTIYGGNIASTMAGEFSFSCSVSAGVLFLGLLVAVIRTGRYRGRAALLLALTALCHLLPTIFVAVGAVLLIIAHVPWLQAPRDRLLRFLALAGVIVVAVAGAAYALDHVLLAAVVVALGAVAFTVFEWRTQYFGLPWIADVLAVMACGGALTAFWVLPFKQSLPYTNDMGWEKITKYVDNLFPWTADKPPAGAAVASVAVILGIVGALFAFGELVKCFIRFESPSTEARTGAALATLGAAAALVFRFLPQYRLWNARALPFWFLCCYLMAAFGLFSLGRYGAALLRWFSRGTRTWRFAPTVGVAGAGLLTYLAVGTPLQLLPGALPIPAVKDGKIGLQRASSTNDSNFAPGWARYNFQGYEGRADAWPEYRQVVQTMKTLPCGRAMWEYEEQLSRFGTPLALMLLPYWTDGCIGSMEGLYFESSATTPFHFLNAALVSARPSNPQRDMPYGALDLKKGIARLQQFGVRYYMAFSTQAIAQADQHPDLRLVATAPYTRSCSDEEKNQNTCPTQWKIYEIGRSAMVSPLVYEPAVVTGIGQGQTQGWLDMAVTQYGDQDNHPVPLVASGPKEWQRVPVSVVKPTTESNGKKTPVRTWGVGTTIGTAEQRLLPPVAVTNIKHENDEISFDVDRVGVPVLVKISYFPNWKVSGGKGPYRVAPNLMVVVPTRTHVSMDFGRTGADLVGGFASALAVVAGLGLWRADRKRAAAGQAFTDARMQKPIRASAVELDPRPWDGDELDGLAKPDESPVGVDGPADEYEPTTAQTNGAAALGDPSRGGPTMVDPPPADPAPAGPAEGDPAHAEHRRNGGADAGPEATAKDDVVAEEDVVAEDGVVVDNGMDREMTGEHEGSRRPND